MILGEYPVRSLFLVKFVSVKKLLPDFHYTQSNKKKERNCSDKKAGKKLTLTGPFSLSSALVVTSLSFTSVHKKFAKFNTGNLNQSRIQFTVNNQIIILKKHKKRIKISRKQKCSMITKLYQSTKRQN